MKISTNIIAIIALFITTICNAQVQDATGISLSNIKREIAAFKKEVEVTKARNLPVSIDTNFDSFIDEADYNDVDKKALKLDEIVYHNFNKAIHSYKVVASYRLEFSEDFYSTVVTVIKGDSKMESILINYTLDGDYIASILVAYDELPNNVSRTQSRITRSSITRNHTSKEGGEVYKATSVYRINSAGEIEELSPDEVLVEDVIQQLGLENANLNRALIIAKVNPSNTQETIMVIPEYAEKDEEETYFELNSHIVLVNNLTCKITHKYYESSETNGWISDAIHLTEITIDTAPYIVAKDTRAFGVRVNYNGSSSANPYSNETISLFVKSGDALKNVLHNFEVMKYGGEWDTNCAGEFDEEKKVLIIAEKITNGFFDIIVKSTRMHSVNYITEYDDCESEKDVVNQKIHLKFDGETYKSY
tara:strand:+ start:2509 stop:3768 length:1260 start_codon:yes stop_codon:yes gene_type:complete